MEDYEVEAPLTERPSLPHSEEAEVAVIGGLMIENSHLDNAMEVVTEDDFFIDRHRLIFSAMQSLHERSQPFDVITLSESLDARDELERAGGLVYLSEMAESTPSTSNIMAYANIVRERATVRQLITAANEIDRKSVV